MAKVHERVSTDHPNEVEQHNGWQHILRIEMNGYEHDTEACRGILHTEDTEQSKEGSGCTATTNEDLRYSLPFGYECSPVLRKPGQDSSGEEERKDVVWFTLECLRIADWSHEIIGDVHVDEEMHRTRVYKH